MDRDKLSKTIAGILKMLVKATQQDRIDFDEDLAHEQIISLLAPVIEAAELWEKVEEINNTCDGCLFHINYSCYYDGGCPFAVVLYALTDKEPT